MYTSKHKNNTNHWIEFSGNPHRYSLVAVCECVADFRFNTYGRCIIEK